MFRLGARHIAEGTDHLLFLLALMLPAPLVATGGRWGGYAGAKTAFRRIIKVVTAFTLGHSITLVIGALGWARLPGTLIESAIAVSILVSAVHALVPIFQGREAYIAGGFGLVHGLAFATTLTDFGFDPLTMASSVLGFNLGIEAIQLVVIMAAMPWLVLLARSRVYEPFRVAGAALTGIASAAWFAERAFGWANPIVPLVENVASHAAWILAGLVVLTVAAPSRKCEFEKTGSQDPPMSSRKPPLRMSLDPRRRSSARETSPYSQNRDHEVAVSPDGKSAIDHNFRCSRWSCPHETVRHDTWADRSDWPCWPRRSSPSGRAGAAAGRVARARNCRF